MNLTLARSTRSSPIDRTQGRLLILAAVFLLCYASALTLAPAVRLQRWDVAYLWEHWIGLAAWFLMFALAHRLSSQVLPDRDPYLLPIAGLISGWGLMTIWRVAPNFGLRQSFWLVVVIALMLAGFRLPSHLGFMRRYKYLWLTGGLVLTALTLFLGTNPSGSGPRLWLGCCGVYFQPSEPLKLLLIVYLAAYLADRQYLIPNLLPLLAPTLIMIGISLLLLIFQRDLGTASIFLFLYTSLIFLATGKRRVVFISSVVIVLASVAGYVLFDVVRIRIEAWLNPWIDPSGRSYQIVQSLLAVAAGGVFGRGPGLGSPQLVPVQHSDFIFASVAEEGGLVWALGLILSFALLTARGLRIALSSADNFRRYLALGLITYLSAQSTLIIGGNLRMLPLTGVTLPFVSYGGSSLLTSYLALFLLLHISNQSDQGSAPILDIRPTLRLAGFLYAGLVAVSITTGWWGFHRGPELLTRADNPRRAITDRFVVRGALLDRKETSLNRTEGTIGELFRVYEYPHLSPILGYNHPVYGQSGLEKSLDDYLRGLRGYPGTAVWWSHLLYGQPPPGLDVRLTLDLAFQRTAEDLLGDHTGALILLKAKNGEILAMASHPNFNPNLLDESWEALSQDPNAPLLDRVTLGSYQPGASLGPLLLAHANSRGTLPELPEELGYQLDGNTFACAQQPQEVTWKSVVASGCPAPLAAIGDWLGGEELLQLFQSAGLYSPPNLRLPTDATIPPVEITKPEFAAIGQADLRVSPMQVALAAAALSADGVRPTPRLALSYRDPQGDWVVLPPLEQPSRILEPSASSRTAESLSSDELPVWESLSYALNGPGQTITWYLAGTLPDWTGTPFVLVLVLEEDNPPLAQTIGRSVLQAALQP